MSLRVSDKLRRMFFGAFFELMLGEKLIMKIKKKLFFIPVMFLFACKGPIAHEYRVQNNTSHNIKVTVKYKNNFDSTATYDIMPDSSVLILKTEEMQGFFSDKVKQKNITDVFSSIYVKQNNKILTKNFVPDSFWRKKYIPGIYLYKLIIERKYILNDTAITP